MKFYSFNFMKKYRFNFMRASGVARVVVRSLTPRGVLRFSRACSLLQGTSGCPINFPAVKKLSQNLWTRHLHFPYKANNRNILFLTRNRAHGMSLAVR
jgi:hypothetical protein